MVAMSLDSNASPELIARLVSHQQLVSSDEDRFVTPAKVKAALDSSELGMLVCRLEDAPCGYIGVRWINPICIKIAIGFLEPARGLIAKTFVRKFLDTMFSKAGVIKVVAEVGAWNVPCLRIAATMGFKREGVNRTSCVHDGQVYDQVYIGLTRRDWKNVQHHR